MLQILLNAVRLKIPSGVLKVEDQMFVEEVVAQFVIISLTRLPETSTLIPGFSQLQNPSNRSTRTGLGCSEGLDHVSGLCTLQSRDFVLLMNCVHRPSSYLPSAPFLTPTGTLGCHRGRSSVGRSFTLEVLILLSFLDLRRSLLLLDPSLKRGSWRSTPESDRLVYWSRDTGSRLSGDTV